jgi:hydrogenase maturation protease
MIRVSPAPHIFSSSKSIADESAEATILGEAPTNLRATQSSKVLVIGIGNAYRHDDAAGLMVARRLKELPLSSCEVHEQVGEGTTLMDLWKRAERVVVIDAVQSGGVAGTVHRFNANVYQLPAPIFRDSTHAFGLIEAVELSRALKQLPCNLVIYGIEGQNFEAGTGLSPVVLGAVNDLVERLRQEIETM